MNWFIENAGQLLLCILIFMSLVIVTLSIGIPILLTFLIVRENKLDKKKRKEMKDG